LIFEFLVITAGKEFLSNNLRGIIAKHKFMTEKRVAVP
jgi:hypothetical protein